MVLLQISSCSSVIDHQQDIDWYVAVCMWERPGQVHWGLMTEDGFRAKAEMNVCEYLASFCIKANLLISTSAFISSAADTCTSSLRGNKERRQETRWYKRNSSEIKHFLIWDKKRHSQVWGEVSTSSLYSLFNWPLHYARGQTRSFVSSHVWSVSQADCDGWWSRSWQSSISRFSLTADGTTVSAKTTGKRSRLYEIYLGWVKFWIQDMYW